jgi:flagellar biosynthetic protein FliQ
MAIDPVELVRDALLESLILAAPILIAGLLVGLIISVLQAVTQVQEQTLTFVPKIVAMALVAVALLTWISMRMTEFATAMFFGF